MTQAFAYFISYKTKHIFLINATFPNRLHRLEETLPETNIFRKYPIKKSLSCSCKNGGCMVTTNCLLLEAVFNLTLIAF